jgi:hypothetical protein
VQKQTNSASVNKTRRKINPAIGKLCCIKLFPTFKLAHRLWDSQAKPSRILGGNLNIRSAKNDELQHQNKSNFELFCLIREIAE